MGISVDYSVINAELTELNIMLNDNYVQVAASKLGSEISYSQSDYVDVLLDQVDTIKNIHKIMNGIIEDSMKMLTMARKIYSDGDIEIRDLISQEGEQDG
ncbi:MAG: hypothetical protein V8S88_05060 [Lachnospiraceae bacterium]|jgi:hypothetical protein|nr:hypothetical protein DW062_13745 [Clostridium sp. AF43-10]RHQ71390.1 hypothetical protein DWY08_07110 [Clostridium sp. AF23-8]RHU85391.1 hypothetical protein DXC24_08965 [Clostridium sp. OM08-29]